MAMYANMPEKRDKTDEWVPAPEGQQQAVCCDIEDLGLKQIRWKGTAKSKPRVALYFLSEHKDSTGKPISIREEFTKSLWETARLRKFLGKWRGKALTDEECKTFDLEKLIGVNAMLFIDHNVTPQRTYANVVIDATKPYTGPTPLKIPDDFKRKQDRVKQQDDAPVKYPVTDHDDDDYFDRVPF